MKDEILFPRGKGAMDSVTDENPCITKSAVGRQVETYCGRVIEEAVLGDAAAYCPTCFWNELRALQRGEA